MEVYQTTPQAFGGGGGGGGGGAGASGFIDPHGHTREDAVLDAQARGDAFGRGQEMTSEPSGEADLLANCESLQDTTLGGQRRTKEEQSCFYECVYFLLHFVVHVALFIGIHFL